MNLLLSVIVLIGTGAFQPAGVDPELDALTRGFDTLYESLRSGGGVSTADEAVIRVFRQRVETYAATNPRPRVVAMDLQLSLWLGDEERVNTLYSQLTDMTGDFNIGLAWAAHFQALEDRRKVGEIFSRLTSIFPDEKQILVAPMFRVLLPNGVVVEVPEHADGQVCRELLACASALA